MARSRRETVLLLAVLGGTSVLRGSDFLTPAEAARIALDRNPGVQAAEEMVERARRARAEAGSHSYPRLEAGSHFTRGDGPVYAFGSLLDQREFTQANFDVGALNRPGYLSNFKSYLRVGVPLFTGYELRSYRRLAGLDLQRSELESRNARERIRLAVWEAGVQVLLARETVAMLEERIRASEEEVAGAQRLRRRGLVLGSDYFAAEAVLSGLRAWRAGTAKREQAARESLAVLVGREAEELRLRASLRPGGPALPPPEELLDHARSHRVELRKADLEARMAELEVTREVSSLYPKIDAMAEAQTNTEDFSRNPGQRFLMVRAQWALGDPSYAARRDKAKAEARAGRRRRDAWEDQSRIEILQALRTFEGARDALPLAQATVERARKSLELFRPLHREGRQSILEVLRAEEALARAESLRLETLAQFHIARARTLAAAGALDEAALGALSASVEDRP